MILLLITLTFYSYLFFCEFSPNKPFVKKAKVLFTVFGAVFFID